MNRIKSFFAICVLLGEVFAELFMGYDGQNRQEPEYEYESDGGEDCDVQVYYDEENVDSEADDFTFWEYAPEDENSSMNVKVVKEEMK